MKASILTLPETLKIAVSRRQMTWGQLVLKIFWCEILPNGFQIRKVHEKTSLRFTGFVIWTSLPPFFFRFRFHFFYIHQRPKIRSKSEENSTFSSFS